MKKLRNANDKIQDEIKRRTRKTGGGGASLGEPETADSAMEGIRAAYTKLNKDFSRDALFRLERVEHYVDQFMTGAAALRVKRIEGFQKYDEMVARRMSGLFGYVRLLRSRMADVDTRLSALSRAYASLKAVETTKDIRSLVGSMDDQDRKIEQIQEFGEIALIGFLIPYYVGAALLHYAFHVEGPTATLYWQAVLSFFALIVIARSLLRMRREGQTPASPRILRPSLSSISLDLAGRSELPPWCARRRKGRPAIAAHATRSAPPELPRRSPGRLGGHPLPRGPLPTRRIELTARARGRRGKVRPPRRPASRRRPS